MFGDTNPDLRAVLGAAPSDYCAVYLRKPSDFERAARGEPARPDELALAPPSDRDKWIQGPRPRVRR